MDKSRIGLFTSSQIYRLMTLAKDKKSFGAPALSYIKEKKKELRLKAPISLEATSHSLSWGKAMEGFVHETKLGVEYELLSDKTDVHESGLFGGTKDVITSKLVGDIKCPLTRASFCDLVEIIESDDLDVFKSESPEYYYQLVCNSILTKKEFAELIVYMPYEKDIPAFLEYIELIDDFQLQKDIQWVVHSELSRIPHLPNDSEYKDLYKFQFAVPKEDQEEVFEKVKIAHTYLSI